jgi:hypothetical protein
MEKDDNPAESLASSESNIFDSNKLMCRNSQQKLPQVQGTEKSTKSCGSIATSYI